MSSITNFVCQTNIQVKAYYINPTVLNTTRNKIILLLDRDDCKHSVLTIRRDDFNKILDDIKFFDQHNA